jgi:hypothetical protein
VARSENRSDARRAKAAELRRAQQAHERRRKLTVYAGIAAVVLVAAAVLAYAVAKGGSSSSSASGGQILPTPVTGLGNPVTEKPAVKIADTSGIPGVVAYAARVGTSNPAGALEATHVPGPVVYSVTPPVGGPHNAIWMNCGIYTKPVPNERAVHDMEHGAIWITYRPDLSAADVSTLRSLVLKQPKVADATGAMWRYMDLTPWVDSGLPAPIVLSAWGRQLTVDAANDPRLQRFIDAFRAKQGITPEFGSPCGGQPAGVGGRPDAS